VVCASQIGRYCARVNLGEHDLLITLRAYLDSSGKLENDYITLAAFAANDEMWKKFETDWHAILDGHTPKAKYVHMRELAHQVDGFDRKFGWTNGNAFGLAEKCLVYMSHLDKKRFHMFYCAVDLKAWRTLRAETYPLPSPIEMCNQFCPEGVMLWHAFYYPDVIDLQNDSISYFFDKGEPFKQPFEDKWIQETKRSEETGVWSVWNRVQQVTPADMKKVPGIQAADILAWAVNREQTTAAGKKGTALRHTMMQAIPAFSVVWDEAKMRKHFKPLLYLPQKS
jgi:hypothetical protein